MIAILGACQVQACLCLVVTPWGHSISFRGQGKLNFFSNHFVWSFWWFYQHQWFSILPFLHKVYSGLIHLVLAELATLSALDARRQNWERPSGEEAIVREGARSRANLLGISPHDTGARSIVKPNLASSIKFCSGSRPSVGGRDPEQIFCSGSRPNFWGEIPSKFYVTVFFKLVVQLKMEILMSYESENITPLLLDLYPLIWCLRQFLRILDTRIFDFKAPI